MNEIEKIAPAQNQQKKITAYLDGTLSPDERSEFEAFVRTNPSFQKQIRSKAEELEKIKGMIPTLQMSKERSESIQNEMKVSVLNLLKEEPKNFREKIKLRISEFFNR